MGKKNAKSNEDAAAESRVEKVLYPYVGQMVDVVKQIKDAIAALEFIRMAGYSVFNSEIADHGFCRRDGAGKSQLAAGLRHIIRQMLMQGGCIDNVANLLMDLMQYECMPQKHVQKTDELYSKCLDTFDLLLITFRASDAFFVDDDALSDQLCVEDKKDCRKGVFLEDFFCETSARAFSYFVNTISENLLEILDYLENWFYLDEQKTQKAS